MNYPAFMNDSLTMMYEGIRGVRAAANDRAHGNPISRPRDPRVEAARR
jgi:hypothetical protein